MLAYVTEPYPQTQQEALLHDFRTKGYMILPSVFDAESVPGFRQRVLNAAVLTTGQSKEPGTRRWFLPPHCPELVEPIRAPRIRSMLPGALSAGLSVVGREREDHDKQVANPGNSGVIVERSSPSGQQTLRENQTVEEYQRPLVQVCDTAWLIDDSTEPQGWHRDRWWDGEDHASPSGMAVNSPQFSLYSHPEVVHLAMYFEDVNDMSRAPTQLVPGSHRDPYGLDPRVQDYEGPIDSFLIQKTDCVVWDQRCWHRRSKFTPQDEDDVRVVSIYGFQAIDHYMHWGRHEME